MGFMFRLCFWLGVTLAIMPADERPGEALAGTPDGVTLEERLTSTVQSAWALVTQISTACEDNPQLCQATAALAQTAAHTGETLMTDVTAGVEMVQAVRPKASAPIDAPSHDFDNDGRVGRGQSPAG